MEIYYQGTNITEAVLVRSCVVRDVANERCDSLDIVFENAAGWYRWQPEEDDEIVVTHNGYDSGAMYLNTILPEDGKYRIFATSLPCAARAKGNMSFAGRTIEEIMRACAIQCGMGFRLFGLKGGIAIPYIERNNEGCAAFLRRLLTLEGAALKCVNGAFTAIGIAYAQRREPLQRITLAADQPGVEYMRCGQTLRALRVDAPYASATAEDMAVPASHSTECAGLPARDDGQAGRWARGLLLEKNRACERLMIPSTFNPGFTAMERIDIEGGTDAAGAWLIEEVTHDLIQLKSTAKLRRCISTIR